MQHKLELNIVRTFKDTCRVYRGDGGFFSLSIDAAKALGLKCVSVHGCARTRVLAGSYSGLPLSVLGPDGSQHVYVVHVYVCAHVCVCWWWWGGISQNPSIRLPFVLLPVTDGFTVG